MAGHDKERGEIDDMTRRLQFVATHYVQAKARLEGAAGGDGYPGGSGSGGGGGGTSSDTPVERAAAQRMRRRGAPDPVTADLRRLDADLARAVTAVFRLQQSTARYVPGASVPAPVCARCAGVVSGATRRGLCMRCYQAWVRSGRPEQATA